MNDLSEFRPSLCGMCMHFREGANQKRDDKGRYHGWCRALDTVVTRTDWCHKPEEIEMQKAAMAEYKEQAKIRDAHALFVKHQKKLRGCYETT